MLRNFSVLRCFFSPTLRHWSHLLKGRQQNRLHLEFSSSGTFASLVKLSYGDSLRCLSTVSPPRLSTDPACGSSSNKQECTGTSGGAGEGGSPNPANTSFDLECVEKQISRLVPPRFTTISHIARTIPGDLMESLSEHERGGLLQFLQRRPKIFEVTCVAGVLRARLRVSARAGEGNSRCHLAGSTDSGSGRFGGGRQNGINDFPLQSAEGDNSTLTASLAGRRSHARTVKRAPARIYDTYPTYCIPFTALVQYYAAQSCLANEGKDIATSLWEHLDQDREFLTIVRLYDPTDDIAVKQSRTFISISPSYHLPGMAGGHGRNEFSFEADRRYRSFEVEPYEWFRIARICPHTKTFMSVTPSLLQEAQLLLPSERDPVHVWASAPELFDIRIGDGEEGELGMLCVRFILHPSYLASSENKTEEELVRQLEELAGPTQRTKKKRRRLRRALQCLKEPLSFLDERVWAHFIFDSLPETSSATAEMVVSMLPEGYKNCTPVQWRTTLQKFPTLFKVYNGPVDLLIQRADLPMVQMRPLEEISAEEVLQEIYKCYPLRFHPEIGVTISQMLTKLPKAISQRLYTMENVEKELLLKHQDKIEILRSHTFFLERQGGPPVFSANGKLRVPFKARPEMLQQVRGREDFLIGFRFIGEWQDRLIEKFVKRCQKYDCDPETTSFLPIPV